MEKDDFDQYEAFRRGNSSNVNSGVNDRKMSMEYFREESRRIDAVMKQQK